MIQTKYNNVSFSTVFVILSISDVVSFMTCLRCLHIIMFVKGSIEDLEGML